MMADRSKFLSKPPRSVGLAVSTVLVIAWLVLRLAVFETFVFPLTYAIPLLVCVWTGDRRALWGMAGVFAVADIAKQFLILPAGVLPGWENWATFGATILNIGIGALVVHLVIDARGRLEQSLRDIQAANQHIRAQADELAQQNEELTQQSEELEQQAEEMAEQNEELQMQSETITGLNVELSRRGEILESLLNSARLQASEERVLNDICAAAADIFGAGVAIHELQGDMLVVRASAGIDGAPANIAQRPSQGTFTEVVVRAERTAALNDVSLRPDLSILEIPNKPPFRALLAAPLRVDGSISGAVTVYGGQPQEWTDEHFRIAEWIAAQTGHILEALRLQSEQKRMEEELRKDRDELERRVRERTDELQRAYDRLVKETEEKERVEQQLRQAQKMEALGTLSGGIAHDFNNILAAIIGFTELVAGHAVKGSRDERRLRRIMEASVRGRELVQQMLTFSRKTEQEKKPLLVGAIIKESIKFLRASIPATISIKTNVKGESNPVLGDPVQIQQILMNLCTNAAYAMQEKGGTLDIQLGDHSVSPSNGDPPGINPGLYTKLVVHDTGTGISSDIMDKIFDPFFTTKKLGEGTGLGLSVVHGIVKQHDGYITVKSEPGKGSAFTVYFPQIARELEISSVSDDEIPTGSKRILFVDDEEALVEMAEDILTELGYEVTTGMNGNKALVLLNEDPSRFDLVITDQTMPEMTGFELAKEILAIRPDMPIIMCTGFSHVVDADKAKTAGIRAFAMKPLTKREIAKTIRKALNE